MVAARGLTVVIACLMVSAGGRAAEPTAATAPRWNVLFVFADDWGRYASCYRGLDGRPGLNDVLSTPAIDRLAREGVLFRHAFVSSPSCTPCRSSLLSGRHFFQCGRGAILRNAVRLAPAADPGLRGAVIACRVFVAACLLAGSLFVRAGLDWPLAALLVAGLALGFLLSARITAEIGIPFLPGFTGTVATIPLRILGPAVFGPQGLVVMSSLNFACIAEQDNSIAAQETARRKLEEAESERLPRRLNGLLVAGLALGLAAGVFFTLWNNYSFGARQEGRFLNGLFNVEKVGGIAMLGGEIGRLRAESASSGDKAMVGLPRLLRAQPEKQYWKFFSLGVVVVGGCALLRLRFSGWPFHPLPLLLLGSWILSRLYFAFLLGWLIKVALLRIGGGRVFARSKPFFFGVIAGSVVMSGIWLAVGIISYLTRNIIPPVVNFFI